MKLCFKILLVVVIACSEPGCERTKWNPDTKQLDSLAKVDPQKWENLAHSVENFYDSLYHKKWNETYDYRTTTFRRDVSRDLYLRSVQSEQTWSLLNYRILKVDTFGESKVRLLIQFIDNPGPKKSEIEVWWKKEGEAWRCEEAGPIQLPLTYRVTLPENENSK
jgi:hypothetical protein